MKPLGVSERIDRLRRSYHLDSASVRARLDADMLEIDSDLMNVFEANGLVNSLPLLAELDLC